MERNPYSRVATTNNTSPHSPPWKGGEYNLRALTIVGLATHKPVPARELGRARRGANRI
ncbi:protein of unknown function [Nitrospina watsonii]|uniref:Uncharacterized protein n=1 Tax=Nitrospina watsonii TaxID=1323948 RepID=A0ABN8VWT5_9BACT|nr:protein of unknown function [Nitrospina watsonii]